MRPALLVTLTLCVAACGGKIEPVGDGRSPGGTATSAPSPADPPDTAPTAKPFDPAPPPPPAVTTKEADALCAKVDRAATPRPIADADALGKATLGSWYACDGDEVTQRLFDVKQPGEAAGIYMLGPGSAYWLRSDGGELRAILCLECTMRVKFIDGATLSVDGSPEVSIDLLGGGAVRMRRGADPALDSVFVRLPR